MTTAIGAGVVTNGHSALAQTQAETSFSVPAGPLNTALSIFGRQAGLQISYLGSVTSGRTSPGLTGTLTHEQAFSRLLDGTGISYAFVNPTTVIIADRGTVAESSADDEDSAVLDTIHVMGGAGDADSSVYSPFGTAAPTAHISGQNIERFRGSSPADMFRGTPGVLSGEARNGAGSIDPNIRGMQGLGRVAVTVDGAENQVTVYQGYQGISSRTFVDPDFVAGIDITKGSDATSAGIAGTVAIRTLGAGDIVREGNRFGLRVRGGFGTNTSAPEPGNMSGYLINNPIGLTAVPTTGFGSAVASETGMDRPSFLRPTQGSASIVGAARLENVEFLAGYAYRERGNYHAGTNGPHANPVSTGSRPFCYSNGFCPSFFIYRDYIENDGLVNYRPGEEVLNTQLRTESHLAKGTVSFGDGHGVQLSYTGYRSEAGDILGSRLTQETSQEEQQEQTTGIRLHSGTFRYRWQPQNNDLFDLAANLWVSRLQQRRPLRWPNPSNPPSAFGLPDDFRVGSDTLMWGGDISNTSRFETTHGALSFDYGLSFKAEEVIPSPYTRELEFVDSVRDGERREVAGFGSVSWQPLDWLTLNGGLRYQHYWSLDRSETPPDRVGNDIFTRGQSLDSGGFSPSFGITLEPIAGTQFYVNYSNMMRLPSIMESVQGFSAVGFDSEINNQLEPERSENWEIGANLFMEDVFAAGDLGMLKFGYFNWDVDGYISREAANVEVNGLNILTLRLRNLDRARFSGLEMSGRYEIDGFTAELSANYYLGVEFCPTADTCDNRSIYADYATNQVPPKYTFGLTLSQSLFDDVLTIGGRVTHVGSRAADHGDVTSAGRNQFISLIEWDPYTLVDVFSEVRISDNLTASVSIENLFDRFYVDPLSIVTQPGPGRTLFGSLTVEF